MYNIKSLGTFDFDKTFALTDAMFNLTRSRKTTFRRWLGMFKLVLIRNSKCRIEYISQSSKILFLNTESTRKDGIELIENVAACAADYDLIMWDDTKSISFIRSIDLLCHLPFWILQEYRAHNEVLPNHLFKIIEIYDRKKELLNCVNIRKYNLLVVLYDATTSDNFFVQFFKQNGIKTATIQHGIMLAPRKGLEDNVDFCGIEFKNSVSDYFLAWNDFTKHEAIKSGIENDKIVVLGVAKCLGKKYKFKQKHQNRIGLLLDGIFQENNNVPMIKIVDSYCKKHHIKYIVRYHPNFNGDEYNSYISDWGCVSNKNTPLIQFLDDIDLCILANSTALFEFECFGVPFLRYGNNGIQDKFRDYPCPTFYEKSGFYKNMDRFYNNRLNHKCIYMLDDISMYYKNFFVKFSQGDNYSCSV